MQIACIVFGTLLAVLVVGPPTFHCRTFAVRNPPPAPCQHVFEYHVRNDHYVYGLLTVPSPPLDRVAVPLLVTFLLSARLPTKYGGLIELRHTQSETIRDIRQRRPIQFMIHFPVQSPLPQLTRVLYDNVLLCGAANVLPSLSAGRPVVNRIEFRYAFNTTDIVADVPATTKTIRPTASPAPESNEIHQQSSTTTTTVRPSTTISTTTTIPTTTRRPRQNRCGQLDASFTTTSTGTQLERGSWPWLTAIYTVDASGPRFLCAGTLIAPSLVVTAASCLLTSDTASGPLHADQLIVMLGRHNMSMWFEPGTDVRELAALHIHPDFGLAPFGQAADHQEIADIAVMVLRSDVVYSTYILPVCLWHADGDGDTTTTEAHGDDLALAMGTVGTVVGWGGGPRPDAKLRAIPASMTISAVPMVLCQQRRQQMRGSFCAGTRNGRRTCVGDAGSGFVVMHENRLTLRGVMAMSPEASGDCDRREYYLFTDVVAHTDWIETFMD